MQETQKNAGSIPGSGKSPGGGNGNPLQYSCLENIMDRGAWWATVHRVSKNWTWLSTHVSPSLIPEALNFLPLQGCMYVLFPWIWVPVYLPLWFSSAQLLSSVQFSSIVSDSLQPHGLQHTRPPCPSPTPGVYPDSVHWVGDAIQPLQPTSG